MKYTLLFLVLLAGCSRESALEFATAVGHSHNLSQRDGVIRNWQAKIADTPACSSFAERFKTAGTRYDNAVNGSFMNDMMKIWSDAKAAGCAARV